MILACTAIPPDANSTAERVPTNGSLVVIDEEEDPNHPEHKQDWNVITDPKDSWAVKERRRSSIFATAPVVKIATSPTSSSGRQGSILSIWSSGKDKDGKSILHHDDHDVEGEQELTVEEVLKAAEEHEPEERTDRRGSILSLWSKGTDENGRAVILHDDEEWDV
jgi:hypothetical protein